MSESQEEIERYNRRELWADVSNRLSIAEDSIEQALGALEDLGFTRASSLYEYLSTVSARLAVLHGNAESESKRDRVADAFTPPDPFSRKA